VPFQSVDKCSPAGAAGNLYRDLLERFATSSGSASSAQSADRDEAIREP